MYFPHVVSKDPEGVDQQLVSTTHRTRLGQKLFQLHHKRYFLLLYVQVCIHVCMFMLVCVECTCVCRGHRSVVLTPESVSVLHQEQSTVVFETGTLMA